MKLNPTKCAFGVSARKFPRFMELQRLTSRLAALGHFIACFIDKLRHFFLTLKGASTLDWIDECNRSESLCTSRPIWMNVEIGNQVEYGIEYQSRLSLKGQVIVDFIVELPKKQTHPIDHFGEQWWTLHVDGSSRVFGSGVGLVLQSPTVELIEQAIRLNFSTSNNEAEYEAMLAGLDLALMLAATKLEIRSDSQLIVE
ncbi:hypothetical protein AAG906_040630 [Vitis piasezkii]